MSTEFVTINDYKKIKEQEGAYDLIKSYTVYYINKFKAKKEAYNTQFACSKAYARKSEPEYIKIINYAKEKSNCSYFLFHNEIEKSIFVNNVIFHDDENFMEHIIEANAYDALLTLINDVNKICTNTDDNEKKRAIMLSVYMKTYNKKNEDKLNNLKNRMMLYKGEYSFNDTVNKFTEIYVFNEQLINRINGYEEKVYIK